MNAGKHHHHRAIRLAATSTLAALLLLLGGCAGQNATQRAATDTLHDAESRIAMQAEHPVGTPEEAVARGDMALQRGDLDRALYFFVEAVSLDPHDVVSLLKVGGIHAHRRNHELALAAYRMVLSQEPDNLAALEGAGLALFRTRRPQEARPMLERVATREPLRWQVHDALGVIADLNRDYEAAIGHYAEALRVNPDSARLYNNRGYSRYLNNDLDGAAEDFLTAIGIDAGFERAWRNLALVRSRQGDYEEALDLLREVSDEAQALNDIGYLAMLDGRYAAAEQYLNDAIAASPTYYRMAHENLRRLRERRSTDTARSGETSFIR